MIICSPPKDEEELKRWLFEADLAIMPSGKQEFGMFGLAALSSGLPILVQGASGLGLWHMSWVVHHPLWYQRMSVSGPRQLGRLGTRVGKYGLKRLIYCSNIIMRCTVGRKSVEILSRRCWRWLLVWISFMRLACVDYTKSYYSSCQSKAMYMVTAVDVNTVVAW